MAGFALLLWMKGKSCLHALCMLVVQGSREIAHGAIGLPACLPDSEVLLATLVQVVWPEQHAAWGSSLPKYPL